MKTNILCIVFLFAAGYSFAQKKNVIDAAMLMKKYSPMAGAEEAKDLGLVNYVCTQEELIFTAEKIASKIKRNSPAAIAKAIKSVNAGFICGIDGFEVEKQEFGNCFGTSEFIEGTTAFMEKRKPNF